MNQHDVIIVGAGAAGLSAARVLKRCGIEDILVLERETQAGGLPRHSHHPGFGFSQFGIPYFGPSYVRRLLKECKDISIQTQTTVCQLNPGGELTIADQNGMMTTKAKAVLITTGIRESSGVSQLISSQRPWGMFSTGAVQQFLHFTRQLPFRRPVIIGSEWVSYSVVLTLKKAGLAPVAIVEEHSNSIAPYWVEKATSHGLRIPIFKQSRLSRVIGTDTVSGVEIRRHGSRIELECDAVIFTGKFIPESSLAMDSHLEWDPKTLGPKIDQYWRCSDHSYFAAGNVLRPVETSGIAGREGQSAARAIAGILNGETPSGECIPVQVESPLEYVCPQWIRSPGIQLNSLQLRSRMERAANGVIKMICNGTVIWQKSVEAKPLQRIRLPVRRIKPDQLRSLEINFVER